MLTHSLYNQEIELLIYHNQVKSTMENDLLKSTEQALKDYPDVIRRMVESPVVSPESMFVRDGVLTNEIEKHGMLAVVLCDMQPLAQAVMLGKNEKEMLLAEIISTVYLVIKEGRIPQLHHILTNAFPEYNNSKD